MKIALDTNILVYAEGVNDGSKRDAVLEIISRLPQEGIVIPAQALGELFAVLVKKAGKSRKKVRDAVLGWTDSFAIIGTNQNVVVAATGVAADHQLSTWDSIVICAAADAGCRVLISEDLQNGFTWNGVTVVNPFASPRHELLRMVLASS